MNITITSRKFKARESLKDYINEQVESLEKFHDDILDVEAILSFTNSNNSIKTCELIIKVPGTVITATEDSDEFEKSVRAAIDKASRQLRKLKTKMHVHL